MWWLTLNKLIVDQCGTIGFHYCLIHWSILHSGKFAVLKGHVITSNESAGSNKSSEIFPECALNLFGNHSPVTKVIHVNPQIFDTFSFQEVSD